MIPILRGDQVEAFFGEEGGETSLKTFSEKAQLKKSPCMLYLMSLFLYKIDPMNGNWIS